MEPLILGHHPGAFVECLCIVLERHDGQFCVYARQEAPMPDPAADLDTLRADFREQVGILRELLHQAELRERDIMQLWELMETLEAGQEAPRAAAGESA